MHPAKVHMIINPTTFLLQQSHLTQDCGIRAATIYWKPGKTWKHWKTWKMGILGQKTWKMEISTRKLTIKNLENLENCIPDFIFHKCSKFNPQINFLDAKYHKTNRGSKYSKNYYNLFLQKSILINKRPDFL